MYFKDMLRYRNVWLGFAMVWIILFHCPLDFGWFGRFTFFGYAGVDICLFASGIGCFYSLSSEPNIANFMKRRLKKLLPTYLVFILVWLVYQYFTGSFGIQMALGNILAIQNFTGKGYDFNWYISAILLLYILAPYFKSIAEKSTTKRKVMFLVFLVICSVPFWTANTYIITVTRVPIFYIGMIFADICKKDVRLSSVYIIGMIVSFVLGVVFLTLSLIWFDPYMWSYGLYWYPFILITPPLCIAISCFALLLERSRITKLINSFFSICGKYSFELYLVHILLMSYISACIEVFEVFELSGFIWVVGCIALFLGCFILRRVTELLCNICNKVMRKTG